MRDRATVAKGNDSCPDCGTSANVIPIVYGKLSSAQHRRMLVGLIVMGGAPMYEDSRDPTRFCTGCETSFRPQGAAGRSRRASMRETSSMRPVRRRMAHRQYQA